jgi:hypothetical protein
MTDGQYRALVAYLSFWAAPLQLDRLRRLDEAIADIGITDGRQDVIHDLWKCGWKYNDKTGVLIYDDSDGDEDDT